MKKIGFTKIVFAVAVFYFAGALFAQAQTLTTLDSFGGNLGIGPRDGASLIQGTDGNFYGASRAGLNSYAGTVFKITPAGTMTVLYTFCSVENCADGANPMGTLAQGTDGNFYGVTQYGGAVDNDFCFTSMPGCGTVFKLTPGGKLTTLYSFCQEVNNTVCTDGQNPMAGLIQAANGNLYGTTCGYNCAGTVFEITTTGKLTTLHSFTGADGASPNTTLLQANNGNIYGTTYEGGSRQNGTVFVITTAGQFATLYNFAGDGQDEGTSTAPNNLIQGANGNLYGTTLADGLNGYGVAFELTLEGKLTKLYQFCANDVCAVGKSPSAGLILGTDGNFYGTTINGGTNAGGTAFQMTPAGVVTTLYNFCSQAKCADGVGLQTGLLQSTNGTFYGTTIQGGANTTCQNGCGTAFSLSTGLGPFVAANPTFGTVGRVVRILGNNLTGTTSVTFNGTTAKFQVISDTYLKAQVPSGATSGTIQVTTPSGTLSSNVAFQILP